jgi:hypothetical protein
MSCNISHNQLHYKVPRVLWESLESVLLANSRNFVRECAKRLCVPEKELIKRVIPSSDVLKICIHDTNTPDLQCTAYKHENSLVVHCRMPIVCGTKFCAVHQTQRFIVAPATSPPAKKIKKIEDIDNMPPLWVDEEDNVIDNKLNIIGKWNSDMNRLRVFIIEDE